MEPKSAKKGSTSRKNAEWRVASCERISAKREFTELHVRGLPTALQVLHGALAGDLLTRACAIASLFLFRARVFF